MVTLKQLRAVKKSKSQGNVLNIQSLIPNSLLKFLKVLILCFEEHYSKLAPSVLEIRRNKLTGKNSERSEFAKHLGECAVSSLNQFIFTQSQGTILAPLKTNFLSFKVMSYSKKQQENDQFYTQNVIHNRTTFFFMTLLLLRKGCKNRSNSKKTDSDAIFKYVVVSVTNITYIDIEDKWKIRSNK